MSTAFHTDGYARCWPAIDLRTPTPEQRRRHLDYSLSKEKSNARICLYEYRRSHKAFYLWQAIHATQAALRLARLLAPAGIPGAQS